MIFYERINASIGREELSRGPETGDNDAEAWRGESEVARLARILLPPYAVQIGELGRVKYDGQAASRKL